MYFGSTDLGTKTKLGKLYGKGSYLLVNMV